MGFVLSKFRKEKSTTAVLEGLQVQITELEKYVINTQEQKRRFVSNFVGFTIGAYIVGFALFYFFYFPPTTRERIMYLVPLLLFPVLIVFLRRMFTWYFQRKLNKNGDKLAQLKQKKNKILEQVMDKETYKVAVKLLERFGDKQHSRMLGTAVRGTPGATPLNRSTTSSLQRTPQLATAVASQQQRSIAPYTGVYRNMNNNLNSSVVAAPQLQLTAATPPVRAGQELRRRTPFPIVNERARSALDRIVDFIVGDSPHNRFAMICKECHNHNGMVPMEVYDYTPFICAYCGILNPARKERPVAPRLSLEAAQTDTPRSALRNDSSDSDSSDDEDEDFDRKHLVRRALHEDLPMTDTEADAANAEANADVTTNTSAIGKTETPTTPTTAMEVDETETGASSETETKE